MKRHIIALLALAALAAASSIAEARAQGNKIRGKVRSAAGSNIANAVVNLQTGNGIPINQTVTNNEGDFSFSGLTETGYIVIASAPGFETGSQGVEFSRPAGPEDPGESRMVEVILSRPGAERVPPGGATFTQAVPKEAQASFDRAIDLSKQGKSQESVAALQEALKIFPEYFSARLALANELIKLQKFQEATVELEHARKVNSKDYRVYQAFGLVLSRQNKHALAAAIYGEAFRMNPTDPAILLLKAGALIDHASLIDPSKSKEAEAERARAFQAAERDLAKAFELSGKRLAPVRLQLARVYEKQGKQAEAAAELEQYLRMVPEEKNAAAIREAIKKLRASGTNTNKD